MKVRVEYGDRPIKHIAIQCPNCQSWFYGSDVTKDHLEYENDIEYAMCCCPKCNFRFSGIDSGLEIEEVSYPEVHKGCLHKKTVWVDDSTCNDKNELPHKVNDNHNMDYYCNAMDNRSNIDT
jgi:hypothetical protein